ncbi:MAG: MFS transporter [Treponema sp.]|jgi:MFS family permease|nr:MFS transporter [Treponema sp.]
MNPYLAQPKGRKTITLVGIYFGFIASLMQSASLSTLLPVAATEIGGEDIYPLASIVVSIISVMAMPLYGYIGASRPRAKPMLVVLSLSVGGFLMLLIRAFALNMWIVVITSFFYGLVSAGLFVIGFSLIRDMFEQAVAGTYLGLVGSFMSFGMLAGPAISGVIMDTLGWRAVCHLLWVLFAVSAVLVFCGVRITKEESEKMATAGASFDLPGAVFMMLFMTGFILFLSLGSRYVPFGTPGNWALIAVMAAGLAGLVTVIRRKKGAAIIPSTVLADRNTMVFVICNFLLAGSSMAVFFFMPTYVLYVMRGTATQAALTTTLMSVLGLFLGPVFGRMIARAGSAKFVLTIGTVVRIAVTLLFILLLKPATPLMLVYVLMLLAGFYNSQQTITFSTGPQIQIRPEIRVLGNSVVQVGQNLGSAVAMVVYTIIISGLGVVDGLPVAFWVAAGLAAAALLVGLLLKKLDAQETA